MNSEKINFQTKQRVYNRPSVDIKIDVKGHCILFGNFIVVLFSALILTMGNLRMHCTCMTVIFWIFCGKC